MDSGNDLEGDLLQAISNADIIRVRQLLHYFEKYRYDVRKPAAWLNIDKVLYFSVRTGNAEIVDILLKYLPLQTYTDEQGRQALHHAARDGHFGIVKKLQDALSGMLDINVPDTDGFTPIMLAAEQGHADIVKYLIESSAKNNQKQLVLTVLDIAARAGNLELVEMLLTFMSSIHLQLEGETERDTCTLPIFTRGLKPYRIITYDDMSQLLHAAVLGRNVGIVELLCERGFPVDSADSRGKQPLHVAAQECNFEMVKLLIQLGASPCAKDLKGITPLHETAVYGVSRELFVNLTSVTNTTATSSQCAAIVAHLLEAGADINALMTDTNETPLMIASLAGQAENVQLLIAHGAELNLTDNCGRTALHKAQTYWKDADVKEKMTVDLIEGGSKINIKDNERYTPLHNLAFQFVLNSQNMSVMRALVRYGADLVPGIQPPRGQVDIFAPDFTVQALSRHRNTPLCWLAWKEFYEAAKYLVDAGWELKCENWLDLPGKSTKHCAFLAWLVEQSRTPKPLSVTCRNSIRQYLIQLTDGREILTPISKLPVPKRLKAFLSLDDLHV